MPSSFRQRLSYFISGNYLPPPRTDMNQGNQTGVDSAMLLMIYFVPMYGIFQLQNTKNTKLQKYALLFSLFLHIINVQKMLPLTDDAGYKLFSVSNVPAYRWRGI